VATPAWPEGQERGATLRDLGRRDRFHPAGTERPVGIPGGSPAAEDGWARPRPVRSGDTWHRPDKLDTQVSFQLVQGVEEQNEDYYYYFFISLQEIFILN